MYTNVNKTENSANCKALLLDAGVHTNYFRNIIENKVHFTEQVVVVTTIIIKAILCLSPFMLDAIIQLHR